LINRDDGKDVGVIERCQALSVVIQSTLWESRLDVGVHDDLQSAGKVKWLGTHYDIINSQIDELV
jgi:hypothetical protein